MPHIVLTYSNGDVTREAEGFTGRTCMEAAQELLGDRDAVVASHHDKNTERTRSRTNHERTDDRNVQ